VIVPEALLSTLAVAGVLLVIGLVVGGGLAILMSNRNQH
jgi:flagellar biosynthesis protein FliQ